jgi:outer membrane cobalamin receptor
MGRLKVRAEVNNLFAKYDEAYLNYPGPGRNFYVGLVYNY